MSYKLGVIGGMGSIATVEFFKRIIAKTKANCDQDYIDLIILNHATLPDRTYCILNNKKELFLNKIKKDLKLLENSNVSYVAIPCNTSHYFIDELKNYTKLKIINMPLETIKYIYNNYGKVKIGLLGTTGTLKFNIYTKCVNELGLKIILPSEVEQKIIMDSIYELKKTNNLYYPKVEKIIKNMLKETDLIILGCTELSLMKLKVDLTKIVDAMDILVNRSIELVKEMK